MNRMKKIDFNELSEWAWAIRELPSSIESLFIDKDLILAGDKDGNILCWNHEGERIWNQYLGNRVENFKLIKKNIDSNLFLVAGLELVAINSESGKINWRYELEGISDYVEIDEFNERVIATSSVFDIEYYDFLEGSYWIFSLGGELLDSQKMDEKAWHLHSNKNGIFLGLGRPSNKILRINAENNVSLNTINSPICCGYKHIFGHANGSISILVNDEIITEKISESAINAIQIKNNSILISNEDGELFCKEKDKLKWKFEANEALVLLNCFTSKNMDFVFASTRTDNGSNLYVLNLVNGELIFSSFSDNSIRTVTNYKNMLIMGLNNGKMIILESELLLRRMYQENNQNINDNERMKMLEKLRKLRK